MTILLIGKTDFKYNRVQVLTAGLEGFKGVKLLFLPIKTYRSFDKSAFYELEKQADFIYIPPFRHRDVQFVKRISTKPIVFDPLISKYLTKEDFGHFWKLPLKYFLDKIPFELCDVLIADTLCHKNYFTNKFNIPQTKIHVLPIGVDTRLFTRAVSPKNRIFKVGFYGNFVPLQGTHKIVETANILREHSDIHFELIGNGYRFQEATALAKKFNLNNITFSDTVEYKELSARISHFDICLGVFGESDKAGYVIPNKVYHYAAVGKCIVTRESDGIKEIFTPDHDIICTSTVPEDIAEKILALKADPAKVNMIAENAYKLVTKTLNETAIAQRFLSILTAYEIANK